MRFVKGKMYQILFWDHCTGGTELIKINYVGWVVSQDKERLTLTSWLLDSDDEQMVKDNMETVNIIKSVILEATMIE